MVGGVETTSASWKYLGLQSNMISSHQIVSCLPLSWLNSSTIALACWLSLPASFHILIFLTPTSIRVGVKVRPKARDNRWNNCSESEMVSIYGQTYVLDKMRACAELSSSFHWTWCSVWSIPQLSFTEINATRYLPSWQCPAFRRQIQSNSIRCIPPSDPCTSAERRIHAYHHHTYGWSG